VTTRRRRPASEPSADDESKKRKIKIGSVKLGPIEIGPFEIPWPSRFGRRQAGGTLAAVAVVVLLGGGSVYWFAVRRPMEDAREHMRRGEYQLAVERLAAVSPKLQWFPGMASLRDQARFGGRLAKGERLRDPNVASDLERLRVRYPRAPDVLVFQGLKAYYVGSDGRADVASAIDLFKQAAALDSRHVHAYLLAAERLSERAYYSLLHGDEVVARRDVSEATGLLARLYNHVPIARQFPEITTLRAELLELQGETTSAFDAFAELSSDVLPAIQAAVVSWRLPSSDWRLSRGLEYARYAASSVQAKSKESSAGSGWLFRVGWADGRGEGVILRDQADKACLARKIVEISEGLTSPENRVAQRRDLPCRQAVVDVICVQLLSAVVTTTQIDKARTAILDDWRTKHLRCDARLKIPPVLPGRVAQNLAQD